VTYVQKLADAIRQTHGVIATHLETVPIRETFQGKVAWEGEVEVFSVEHPSGATRCYGWGYPCDADPERTDFVCVLGVYPVTSALTAVQAAIRAQSCPSRSTKTEL
jgi:hypothetical protein